MNWKEPAQWQIRDRIDVPLDEVVIDTFAYPEDALRSTRAILNVVVARKSNVKDLVDWVGQAGLRLETIDIPDMAFRNIASLYGEEGRPIVVLVLDEFEGTILFYKDDRLYFSRKIGASVFDKAGEEDKEDADLEQLCLEIQRSLDYFESQLNQASPRRILVYATSGSERLRQAIAGRLSLDTKVLDLNRLGLDVGSRELVVEERISAVRAVGAALRQESG